MSTSERRTSVQSLEDAFLRRMLGKKDDESAATLAEELFEEIRIFNDRGRNGEATYQTVAVAKKATQLWLLMPSNQDLPKTVDVLWSATVDGWVADSNGLSAVEETYFARFIASVEKQNNLMLTRIKEKLDEVREGVALGKVVRFLKIVDLQKDNRKIVETISRMFGRYARPEDIISAAYVMEAVFSSGNAANIKKIAAPAIAASAKEALDVAANAMTLRWHEGFPKNAEVSLVDSNTAKFTWVIGKSLDVREREFFGKDFDALYAKLEHVATLYRGQLDYGLVLAVEFENRKKEIRIAAA